jgi:YidC/Oxa1 family membrane protein insertase
MADSINGGNNPAQPPKEMSMEMRLLLALLLTIPIMFLGPYFFGTTPAPGAKKAPAPAAQTAPAAPAAADTAAAATAAPAAAVAGVPATAEQALAPLVIDTNVYRITFSNRGGVVQSWMLKHYKGDDNKQLELVNTASGLDGPLSIYFPTGQADRDILAKTVNNLSYYKQTVDPDGLGVVYEFSNGHVAVKKTFRFQKDSYLSTISSEVTIDGKPVQHALQWRGGFGDLTVGSPSSALRAVYYNVTDNKLVQENGKAAEKGEISASGNFSFAGLTDAYFAAAFLPESEGSTRVVISDGNVRTVLEAKPQPLAGVAVSDGDFNHFRLFVGPKDVDLLKRIDPKLEQLIDWGWFAVIAKPLFLVMNWTNDHIVHNYGWSIILITIVINFLLFPLKLSSMKSMRKMQALKPYIDAINAKYKNMSVRDPRQAEKTQETMDLYKKYGVNPMGGCFPMLIQLPILYAFYRVFMVSVEMRGASWLWVTDLSRPEHLPIHILPVVMIASQFFMQKMMPQPGTDPAQQKMTMFMPLIFGLMFYNFASGLVLYYLTSNLVNMAQQWFFNHTDTARAVAQSITPPPAPKKKNGRK